VGHVAEADGLQLGNPLLTDPDYAGDVSLLVEA